MAAAFAALVSLRHIIEHIEHHPRPPISLDRSQIQSLTEKLAFLQDFLEGYSINGGDKEADRRVLEGRISDAAYAAEDIIESHIVHQIKATSTSSLGKKFSFVDSFRGLLRKGTGHGEEISSIVDLYQGVEKVIQDLDSITGDVAEIKEKTAIDTDQMHRDTMPVAVSLRRSPALEGQKDATMVGFDDVLIEVMDKLTGQQSNRQTITIVGMGGIGKTTLARNIYINPLIVQRFDSRGWATISQEYNPREILLEVLLCLKHIGSKESCGQMSKQELGDKLYKSLYGRRYLVVMDDIWSIDAWDEVKFFFPDNNDGSAILLTTRLSNLAFELSSVPNAVQMRFLDEDKSWNLFCKSVFGEEDCPLELEEMGKKIAKTCKGLPLSIAVIGGLLARSKQTVEHWLYIAENLNSIVNLEDNDRCFKILSLSYNQLPVHLKPCFLYMGIFPEDHKIRVSNLIKLWVAEAFLKPVGGKIWEAAAEEYLNDLIDRNLILVDMLGSAGNIKFCTIHDLLRVLCIKEAEKHEFFCVAETNSWENWDTQRRIGVHESTSKRKYIPRADPNTCDIKGNILCNARRSASLARSLVFGINGGIPPLRRFRLLRILNEGDKFSYFERKRWGLKQIFRLVNSRHLAIVTEVPKSRIPSSVYQLWNIQTLVFRCVEWKNYRATASFDIWKLPQLRHVKFYDDLFNRYMLHLPDPPLGDDFVVLGNLQTLETVRNFKCSEEVVRRIPNIKKLKLVYKGSHLDLSRYCLNNLCRLHTLESLCCDSYMIDQPPRDLNFPHSLKKLSLWGTRLKWEDMATKIGSLPHLQVLKLRGYSFIGPVWETVEGQFCSLKFLLIFGCDDLECWKIDSAAHFPCLEHLFLILMRKLKEIPSEIGDIPTLKSIRLNCCSDSVKIAAKEFVKEQEDNGNEGLQVVVDGELIRT